MEYNHYDKYHIVKIPVAEVKKIDFADCGGRKTLTQYYNSCGEKPAVLCNGGFFNMTTGKPVFNMMDEGKMKAANSKLYKWGMCIRKGQLIYGSLDAKANTDFISGYPVLLDNGRICSYDYASELNYNARRTILGYNENYIFVICIDAPGLAFDEMHQLLLSLGVKSAINLDGGGSTGLLINGVKKTSVAYNRAVANVVAIYC